VFDLILKEIMTTSWTPLKSCTHAPYLMRMIEVVTKKCFCEDHDSWKLFTFED
jgi:hypothetical protein